MVLGNGFIADAGILIGLPGLGEVFFRNDFVGKQFFHPFVFLLGCFVGNPRSLYGISVCHILGRKHYEGSAFADAHALYYFSMERNDTGHSGYCNTFVALCSHNPAAGLNHLIESTRFDDARLHAGGLRLSRRQYDFVAMSGGSFRSMLVFVAGSFVLMVIVFALMVMTFLIMSRMGVFFRFVVVSSPDLLLQEPNRNNPMTPMNINFFMIVVFILTCYWNTKLENVACNQVAYILLPGKEFLSAMWVKQERKGAREVRWHV